MSPSAWLCFGIALGDHEVQRFDRLGRVLEVRVVGASKHVVHCSLVPDACGDVIGLRCGRGVDPVDDVKGLVESELDSLDGVGRTHAARCDGAACRSMPVAIFVKPGRKPTVLLLDGSYCLVLVVGECWCVKHLERMKHVPIILNMCVKAMFV